jgi:hypothetical protein
LGLRQSGFESDDHFLRLLRGSYGLKRRRMQRVQPRFDIVAGLYSAHCVGHIRCDVGESLIHEPNNEGIEDQGDTGENEENDNLDAHRLFKDKPRPFLKTEK